MTRALLTLGALLAPTFGSAGPATAQEAPRVAVRLSADTVRVGDPFTVGIVVVGADDVRLPPLLDAADSWEQLEVARIELGDDGIRAYYRLVAWQAGALELPDLVMSTDGDLAREFRVELPAPVVRSVLPAGAEDEVALRGPRPPLERGYPWLLALALLVVALAVGWWWWRRRRASARMAAEESAGEPGAAELARAALVALHARVEAGELAGAAVYDRLEEILREYLAGTREWPPGRPVRASRWTARGAMRELHRHAVLSRFAGVEAAASRLLTDVETSLDWLTKDAA